MSRVNVEFGSLRDPRFGAFARKMAKLGGWKLPRRMPRSVVLDMGRGIVEHLWAHCTFLGSDVVSQDVSDEVLGETGASLALIECDLAEKVEPNSIRLKGGERLLWLARKRAAGTQGAEKRWKHGSTPNGTAISTTDGTGICTPAPAPAPAPAPVKRESIDRSPRGERPPRLDFDSVYEAYPRKAGKAAGIKAAKAKIRTIEDYDALRDACRRMGELWADTSPDDRKFCPHFSTFVNQRRWEDDELPAPDTGPGERRPMTEAEKATLREIEELAR